MPALLTRMSTPPNAATVAATPGIDGLFVADVHRDADGLAASFPNLRGCCIGGLLVQVGDSDFRAFAREGERDLLADAAGGAGDDGGLALELHVRSPHLAR